MNPPVAEPAREHLPSNSVHIGTILPAERQRGIAEPETSPLEATVTIRSFRQRKLFVALYIVEGCEKGVGRKEEGGTAERDRGRGKPSTSVKVMHV